MKETRAMIRPFTESDLHALHRMICHTIEVSYTGVYPPRAVQFFKEHHSEEKIAGRSAAGHIWVLVSDQDGSILATGALVDAQVIGVFVHPDHRRKGYGKAIMAELEKMARAKALPRIALSISLPSRKFYEHCGYEVLEECAIDVGAGEHLKYWTGEKLLPP